jgi:hypothetical protein
MKTPDVAALIRAALADFPYFFSRTLGMSLLFGHKLADLLVTHGLKLTFWS